MVHSFRKNTGPFDLRIKEILLDQCEHATEIFLGDLLEGNTGEGSFSTLPDCGTDRGERPERIFKFKAPRDSTYTGGSPLRRKGKRKSIEREREGKLSETKPNFPNFLKTKIYFFSCSQLTLVNPLSTRTQ